MSQLLYDFEHFSSLILCIYTSASYSLYMCTYLSLRCYVFVSVCVCLIAPLCLQPMYLYICTFISVYLILEMFVVKSNICCSICSCFIESATVAWYSTCSRWSTCTPYHGIQWCPHVCAFLMILYTVRRVNFLAD